MKNISEFSEILRHTPKFSRRELIIGSVGLVLGGVVVASPIGPNFDRIDNGTPLKPENGEAQSTLAIDWLPDTVKQWQPEIEKFSNQYGVDPNLTAIIMTVESGGNPKAVSESRAKGLMQIIDSTAKEISKKFVNTPVANSNYDLMKPQTSIEFGVAYLSHLIKVLGNPGQGPSWNETVGLVAAGYNGGVEGAAKIYRDGGLAALENNPQTHDYVVYVTNMWKQRHQSESDAFNSWQNSGGKSLIVKAAEYKKT